MLFSNESFRTSLALLNEQKAGLDNKRRGILSRVPHTGDWVELEFESVSIRDIIYISAFAGHEFALFRGKKDLLFHGGNTSCDFGDGVLSLVKDKHLKLVVHSHPDYDRISPSRQDRAFLKSIGQTKSLIVSFITGEQAEFSADPFEDF